MPVVLVRAEFVDGTTRWVESTLLDDDAADALRAEYEVTGHEVKVVPVTVAASIMVAQERALRGGGQ